MKLNTLLIVVILVAGLVASYSIYSLSSTPSHSEESQQPAPPAPRVSNDPPVRLPPPSTTQQILGDTQISDLSKPFDPQIGRRITVDEVQSLLDKGEPIQFIDVRNEFDGPMVEGAEHVPVPDLSKWARGRSKKSFVVTYCTCANDTTSLDGVLELQRLGFTHAYALSNGLAAWEMKGLPTQPSRR